jgi:hypothetical protein
MEPKLTFVIELPFVELSEENQKRIGEAIRSVVLEELAKAQLGVRKLDPIAERSRDIGGGMTLGFRAA